MASYRIGVHDDDAGGATLWYDQPDAVTTYTAYTLLRRYGRDGVGVTVQRRDADGVWRLLPLNWRGDE